MNDRGKRRIILEMKDGDSEIFFAMNHLPPGNKIAVLFSTTTRTYIHRSCSAQIHMQAYTLQRGRREAPKVTLTFSRTTLNLSLVIGLSTSNGNTRDCELIIKKK